MIAKIKYKIRKISVFQKGYFMVAIVLCLLLLIGGFSYALFTSQIESRGSLNIITGNLYSLLESENLDANNTITIESGKTKEITVTLKNVNLIKAKFNFYYTASSGVVVSYKNEQDVPPSKEGYTIESNKEKKYQLQIDNTTAQVQRVTFGSDAGLQNKTLAFPLGKQHILPLPELAYQKLFNQISLGDYGSIDDSDREQTFITGENPNNYIWYSGKLWRAVSKDTADNSVKLITQWNQTSINYKKIGDAPFAGSYIETWLNDASVDGFLGNLREKEKFIKLDSTWNFTLNTGTEKPEKTTIVSEPVGLLNNYEHKMSYNGTTIERSYLNNGLFWTMGNPNADALYVVNDKGYVATNNPIYGQGVRPVINLKPDIKIINGNGTIENPYRLLGDYDEAENEKLLNTRYSGEYVEFGKGENKLYRIVSHETGGTKLVLDGFLTKNNNKLFMKYNENRNQINYNPDEETSNTAYFLNRNYLDPSENYLTAKQVEMIEPATWYLGEVNPAESYKLAKYQNETGNELTTKKTNARVGLLRVGELLSGAFEKASNGSTYWLLTTTQNQYIREVYDGGHISDDFSDASHSLRPCVNLKATIKITGGDGTRKNPFTITS